MKTWIPFLGLVGRAAVFVVVLAGAGAGCGTFRPVVQPLPGPGRDGGLYRYTADYKDEDLPFALAGKALLNADRGEGFHINCFAMGLALFPGLPLYAAEQFVICPVVDTALIPYDLALKLWESHVCAEEGLRVSLADADGRPVPDCELSVSLEALPGRRIVYGGKPCPPGAFRSGVATDGDGEAYVPADLGTCRRVHLDGRAQTTRGEETFHAQADREGYWGPDGWHRWEDAGERNRVVLILKGTLPPEEGGAAGGAAGKTRIQEWKVAPFAAGNGAEKAEPPVPEGVRGVVLPAGKGRRAVRSKEGGAASAGVGMDPGRAETVVWNGEGKELWRGRTSWRSPQPVQWTEGMRMWNGGDVPVPARPPVGVVAWNGADVAVRPAGWKKGEAVEVFAWPLEGYGKKLAQKAGEAFGCGTNAAVFNAEADGGWWLVRWDAWEDAPGEAVRLYVLAVKEDADGDGLDDSRESAFWHTDSARCDSDGDTRGDGLEIRLGSNPNDPFLDARLTIHALWSDPGGAGGSWVELYSSAPCGISLDGFRLETARDGEWRTVAAFPDGMAMAPGRTLLIGEKGVDNADVHAELDLPPHWPAQPVAGVRLVWDGAACGRVADAVIVGRGHFPEAGGLDREGWESTGGVRPKGDEPLVRHFPGVDNNRSRDWTTRAGLAGRPSGGTIDTDGDGLPDADEWSGRLNQPWGEPTNPWNRDSDGDGLDDREECCVYHTNPGTWASDGDIYPWIPQGTPVREWPGSDPYEIEHGWNPLVADENGNGIPDSWEMVFGTEDLLGGSDHDGDGISDLEEMRRNCNPWPGGAVGGTKRRNEEGTE